MKRKIMTVNTPRGKMIVYYDRQSREITAENGKFTEKAGCAENFKAAKKDAAFLYSWGMLGT